MKLYYAPGTISLKPHVALLESCLPFVAVRVDEASKRMADGGDYRVINPLGYLPALMLDDGSVLLEAAAIASTSQTALRREISHHRREASSGPNFRHD